VVSARPVVNFDALSIDLPWSESTKSRTVVAAATKGRTVLVAHGVDGNGLLAWITQRAAPEALVLLDVPIEGCDGLSRTCPRRPVDDSLSRVGIPILPSYTAGARGPELCAALQRARPDLRVRESYPYAVLRVLWGTRMETGSVEALTAATFRRHTAPWKTWWRWPPRYKRARTVAKKRDALATVAELLRSCGPEYARLVRAPGAGTTAELARLSDEYDAVLGLIAASAALERNAWSWEAWVPGAAGTIVTIGPAWLRAAFERTLASSRV
jgi:hypothetical protein